MHWLTIILLFFSINVFANNIAEVQLPEKLNGSNVLVLYKEFNAFSKQIADYYAQRRHIPASQVVAVPIFRSPAQLNQHKFESIYSQIKPHLSNNIKVIVLAWHAPYRVECMSITTAFALGFDKKYCSHSSQKKSGCYKTATSPYFNRSSKILWDHKANIRLSMMLSGKTLQQVKQLIDRGVVADNSYPVGDAYLVRTHDAARSTRWLIFKQFADLWGDRAGINVQFIDDRDNKESTQVKYKEHVLFYQTGLRQVPAINTNHYLPGAIADHLTSAGGMGIEQSGQMKAFRWLEAGLTASYGAVVEPCNYTEKFPNPQILIPSYRDGDSLIEAYWKSVQQPGEGLFIGEPLARPWSKTQIQRDGETLIIYSSELNANMSYYVEAYMQNTSPLWQKVNALFEWHNKILTIRIPNAAADRYRIVEQ